MSGGGFGDWLRTNPVSFPLKSAIPAVGDATSFFAFP